MTAVPDPLPDDRSAIDGAAFLADLAPTVDPARRASAAAICRDPARLPPIRFADGYRPPTSRGRPLVVANGLTPPQGCARRADGVPCDQVRGTQWRCYRCGTVTPIVERVPGPRVTACGCWDVVCLHPVAVGPPRPAPSTRPGPRGAA